ncbi:MAG TPA: hypothetical protein VE640_02750, partial [Candidatus Bathyarchaeia archaeon]|nr:hypothetical protein [Candidatus Bathyarchaeia archaeon]
MEPVTTSSPAPARAPWTVRVASWSARHRWPVFVLWFVATISLFAISLAAGGTRSVEAVSSNQHSKYEAGEAYEVYDAANASAGQQAPASQQFLLIVSNPTGTIDDPAFKTAIADMTTRLAAMQAAVDGTSGPVLTDLVNPTAAPPSAGLVSPDRTTVRIVGRVAGDGAV